MEDEKVLGTDLPDVSKRFPEEWTDTLVKCEDAFRCLCLDPERVPGQMIKTRVDEVRNTAGGFVFAVSDETRIRRFIILGTAGGTYYSSEKELTLDNIKALIDIIEKGRGSLILKEVYEVSLAGRNPKQGPLLMALALCARYNVYDSAAHLRNSGGGDGEEKAKHEYLCELHKAAFSIVNEVCRIPTHLFTFVKYCEMISHSTAFGEGRKSTGWGRSMRTAVKRWYSTKTPEQLAVHLTKYPRREGWSHRDLFRLTHPTVRQDESASRLEYEQLYHFVVYGELMHRKRKLTEELIEDIGDPALKYSAIQMDTELESSALNFVDAVLAVKKESNEEIVAEAVRKHHLVWEHIPTDMLNSKVVWQALLENMPMTAMIRSLGKMQLLEVLTDEYRDIVINKLNDEVELKRAKIHPIQVLLAKAVYASGHGDKGKLKWEVDAKIDQALEMAFYKSFINAPPTHKRYCLAFDVSGSMCSRISGTMLSCRTASAALGLVHLKNEETVDCVAFCHELIELPFRPDWTIQQIESHVDGMEFGSTDCALPMIWAKKNNKKFDVFIIYTDCETWFGDIHPYKALQDYRDASGISDAKLVVMGMTATDFTIADPQDAGMMDIVGFDSAVPALLHDFVTGKL